MSGGQIYFCKNCLTWGTRLWRAYAPNKIFLWCSTLNELAAGAASTFALVRWNSLYPHFAAPPLRILQNKSETGLAKSKCKCLESRFLNYKFDTMHFRFFVLNDLVESCLLYSYNSFSIGSFYDIRSCFRPKRIAVTKNFNDNFRIRLSNKENISGCVCIFNAGICRIILSKFRLYI